MEETGGEMMLVIRSRSPRMQERGRTTDVIDDTERKVKRGEGKDEDEVKIRRSRRRRGTRRRWAGEKG